jgi:Tol biopolymer transport system component
MHADGSHQKLLLDSSSLPGKAALFSPSWSPDGQKIAFNVMFLQVPHPDTVIYTADADGSNLRPLTIIAHNEAQPYQQDAGPVWSPNGRQILFWAYHGDSIGSAGISVISPLGGDAKIVTPNGDWSPQWSPDGNLVAYPSGGASGGLFVTGLDGSAPVQITTSRVDRVVWMP